MTIIRVVVDPPRCEICGADLDWVCCPDCGGDGFIEGDPYEFDDGEECSNCGGAGGWLECPNLPHSRPEVMRSPFWRRILGNSALVDESPPNQPIS